MTSGHFSVVIKCRLTVLIYSIYTNVQVMVGKDKGKHGIILQVSRETNQVTVDGLHTRLEEEMEGAEKLGVDQRLRFSFCFVSYSVCRWVEQPLRVDKQEVMLLDPNEDSPCTAE